MSSVGAEGRIARVEFTGTRSELFGLLTRGYLLMIPTIGIYRFWLTTWKRRFYWQHTTIDGDPLEYTGNALQLLIGFLFALAFFLPIYIAFFYLSTQASSVAGIGYGAIIAVFWFLMGYAIYKARDFRLSRTLWRGIRFAQHGSAWGYALRRFLWSIAMVPTAGLIYPWMASNLCRYRYTHTWYGDRQFGWTGSWKTYAKPYFITYFSIVAAVLVGAVITGGSPSTVIDGVPMPGPGAIVGIFLAAVVAFLGWFYFRSREATRVFSEVRIGDARATVKVRARALLAQFFFYALALIGVSILLGGFIGIIMSSVLGSAMTSGVDPSAFDFSTMLQTSWATIALLILGYLLAIGSFAMMGEVFLGFGYWMLVARGATISNADSLWSVRATDEDRALAGEGLADALNVGAY